MKAYSSQWALITNDKYILEAIEGYLIEFKDNSPPPKQTRIPYEYKRDKEQTTAIDAEIEKLLSKGVIEETRHEDDQFVSNIFSRPKKNGGWRIILNLSELNEYVKYYHFKMDNFRTATEILAQDYFMASIDLRDAYYSVPIHSDHRKYLKFTWQGRLYQFKVLPNGLSSAPRLFTKILKPVFAKLRADGHSVLGYIDDTLILGKSKQVTEAAVKATRSMLESLGFVIHEEKSIFEPSQCIAYLGFEIDSVKLTVTLPTEKKISIQEECLKLIGMTKPSIRQVASVIGKVVATFPASEFGPLWYRALERDKIWALRVNHGHFDRTMNLSREALVELEWWTQNIQTCSKSIVRPKPDIVLQSDASSTGWGAASSNISCGGRWNIEEIDSFVKFGINYSEMLAAFYALKSICSSRTGIHIRLQIDNTTAITYINNMGGSRSEPCNKMARLIWAWCQDRRIWLTATHIPGKLNVEADKCSRVFNDRTEWMLNRDVFEEMQRKFGKPEIDLFASRLNRQLTRYVSWHPEPEAETTDAFSLDWGTLKFYAFPPFCLVGKCLQKIINDKASGVLVVPDWSTQPWYALLHDMLLESPMFVKKHEKLLLQPVSHATHPLNDRINLLICRVSGDHLSRRASLTGL